MEYIHPRMPLVLLYDQPNGATSTVVSRFTNPVNIISCYDPQSVRESLDRIGEFVSKGLWAAGFISYETGYCLEPKLLPLLKPQNSTTPLIWMGLFDRKEIVVVPLEESDAINWNAFLIDRPQMNTDQSSFIDAIQSIQAYIQRGETYQVNYCIKLHTAIQGCPMELFSALRTRQSTRFGAFASTGKQTVISLSPELFYRKKSNQIELRPMKGTICRGRNTDEDRQFENFLRNDTKNRAENAIIVDLLRNDVGRIAVPGTVRVPQRFLIEKYQTVFQMVSSIEAEVDADLHFRNLIENLFPCGSITGAPKIRTMEIINQIEQEQRGIYTGAIGYITPENDACFSVAIRTLEIDEYGKADLGIGSGITFASHPQSEYEETLMKARFFTSLSEIASIT